MILCASVLFALNVKIMVRTGELFPGGVTGLTVLIQRLGMKYWNLEIPYTPVNILLNAFPVYVGFRYVGKKFTLLSLLLIMLSGILTDLIPPYAITYDTLLIAIFGGIIGGFSVSLCLRADATSGGTDFIAIYLAQKRGMETWNLILAFNVVILSLAGLLFGWDKALYSIVYQYVSTIKARRAYIESRFLHLNPMQRRAVMQTEGPVLVLAGAGSGKTTVLINRIYNLLEYGCASDSEEIPFNASEEMLKELKVHGERADEYASLHPVFPWQILAITFTNKAASELKDRLKKLLGDEADELWACTFHSACVRILRRDADRIGYTGSFTIYDSADSQSLIKRILKDFNLDEKYYPPRTSRGRRMDRSGLPKDLSLGKRRC